MIKKLCVVVAVLLAAIPAAAHHSFAAQYDRSKAITLKGSEHLKPKQPNLNYWYEPEK